MRVAIIGAGGHAREQLDLLFAMNRSGADYEVAGFIVDADHAVDACETRGLPVLGGMEWIARHHEDVEFVCGIGDSAARYRVAERAKRAGARFATLVHPSAQFNASCRLGEGVILAAGVVLTSDIELGRHVHINVSASISHDCRLGDFASIAPGAHLAGFVELGEGAQIGVGSVIRDRVRIGAWAMSGAGSVIVGDVPGNATVVGVPARLIRTRAEGWQLEE